MKKFIIGLILLLSIASLSAVSADKVYTYYGQCCSQDSDCDKTSGNETCTGPFNYICLQGTQGTKTATCAISPTGCLTDGSSCDPFAVLDPCCNTCQITSSGSYQCGPVNPPPDPDATEPFRPTDCSGPADVYGPALMSALGCISTYPFAFLTDIQGILITVAGGIAFLLMIIGAAFILTSRGNPEQLQRGKEIIFGALTGLILLILSVYLLEVIGVDILNLFNR